MSKQEIKDYLDVCVETAEDCALLADETMRGNILRNVVRPLKDLIALIEKDLPKQKWELVD